MQEPEKGFGKEVTWAKSDRMSKSQPEEGAEENIPACDMALRQEEARDLAGAEGRPPWLNQRTPGAEGAR